ncbi:MAG: STAS domain-containing protein [Eubacteriales bacterium]|jgi:stage II sporulation protein AA (anti-sigma F factor antagonist)|nr:STAS domain-containing protein [Eubacteriales bacterium]
MEKLKCTISMSDGVLNIRLSGSIDHHTVRKIREEIDGELYKGGVKQVVLDFGGVDFMDSSGLGLILGRYTKITDMGGKLTLRGLSDDIMKIIKLSGAEKFIPIEKIEKKEKPTKPDNADKKQEDRKRSLS